MKPQTAELLRKLSEAEWFASVGQPAQGDVIVVSSWEQAVECCSSDDWSNFTLEQQNRLTMFLHTHAHALFQQWNDIVDSVKTDMEPLVDGKMLGRYPLDVKNYVEWEILSACMELEYSDVREPGFFCGLMQWYISGRFPCGWGEKDETGQLRLYGPRDDSGYNSNEPDWLKLVLANQERVYNQKIRLPVAGKLLVY